MIEKLKRIEQIRDEQLMEWGEHIDFSVIPVKRVKTKIKKITKIWSEAKKAYRSWT